MALTVGELAATITVDDSEAEQGLDGFQSRLRSALSRITQRTDEAGREAGGALGDGLNEGAGEGADSAGESITGKFKGLALGVIGGSLGAALMAGIGSAMEQQQITTKLGAQLGATAAQAKRYGEVAGDLYAGAITADFETAAEAIKATMSAGLVDPSATNAQIQSIATNVSDLSSTFDLDLGETATAVGQLIRNGMAPNAKAGLDLIAKGLQGTDGRGEDLLETVSEYGTIFKQTGLDGATSFGLINQALKAGAKDTDVVADSIKEFQLLATSGNSSVSDAFKTLGLDAKAMAKDVAAGGDRSKGAIGKVFDALRKLGPGSAQTKQIVSTLFGGPGEDLGASLFALNVHTASSAMSGAAGSADQLGTSLRDNATSQLTAFKNGMQQHLVEFLGAKVVPALTKVFTFVNENRTVFTVAAVVIGAAFAAMGVAALVAGAEMAAAWIMGLGPVAWVGMAIAALVVLIIAYWDQIKAGTLIAWNWLVDKIMWAAHAVLWIFENFTLPGLLLSHWQQIRDGAVAAWNGMINWFGGIPDRVSGAVSGLGSHLASEARSGWNSFRNASLLKVAEFVSYVRGIPGRVKSALGNMGSLLLGKGQDLVRGLMVGVQGMGGWLRSRLISFAKDMIPGPIAKALGIHSPSRVLADEVGHWIPAGIAMGAENNAGVIDDTMRNLVSVPTAGQATAAGIAARTTGRASTGAGAQPSDVVRIGSDGSAFGDLIISTLRQAVGSRGGNVQFAITGRAA
ncbi:phage tail tape measure protein [Streptomyces sp. NPDC048489]|uniref:phage tail tape measure protein n=1 Tax=Streptomyces sp. NPDC048489 TaxID=3154504 RepID=UPI0034185250